MKIVNNIDSKFTATSAKGNVSAILLRPDDATHLIVLGHGASTNMRHATIVSIAEALAEQALRRSGTTFRIRRMGVDGIRRPFVLRLFGVLVGRLMRRRLI